MSTTATTTPRRHRRLLRVLVVVLVLVLVVAVVAVSILRAARATDGVRPGQLWEKTGTLGLDYAYTLDFQLPVGELVVKVATAVDTVPSTDAPTGIGKPGGEVHSGSEASFVPIGWTLQGSPAGDLVAAAFPDAPRYQFQVVVQDGDRRYDLHAGSSRQHPADSTDPIVTSKAMTLVVAGGGGGLVVEVSYDGLTQRGFVGQDDIDPGVAASLYASGQPTAPAAAYTTSSPCRLFTPAQAAVLRTSSFGCDVGPVRALPYVPGLGWVTQKGTSWSVVDVRIRGATRIVRTGAVAGVYRVTHDPYRVQVDGHGPVEVLTPSGGSRAQTIGGTFVFATEPVPGALRVVASFHAVQTPTRRGPVPERHFSFGTATPVALQ